MMKAIVTNKDGEYRYEVENIVCVNYVEKSIILTTVKDGAETPSTIPYSSEKVIISIM